MAARPLPILALLALLAVGSVVADQDKPTDLERIVQGRFLDRHFLLRVDVKVEALRTSQVMSTTYPSRPSLKRVRPITIVTPDGVFYSADYVRSTQLNVNVRVGATLAGSSPSDSIERQTQVVQGGNIGDVVQLDLVPYTVIPAAQLARIIGVEETTLGLQATLQGFGTDSVQVLLRGLKDPEKPEPDAEKMAARYAELLDDLFYVVPTQAARRQDWIDPGWPESIQEAIQQQQVTPGMTRLQAILAWGNPIHVTPGETGQVEFWLFQRGGTLLEQLRNRVTVTFGGGVVVAVEQG